MSDNIYDIYLQLDKSFHNLSINETIYKIIHYINNHFYYYIDLYSQYNIYYIKKIIDNCYDTLNKIEYPHDLSECEFSYLENYNDLQTIVIPKCVIHDFKQYFEVSFT